MDFSFNECRQFIEDKRNQLPVPGASKTQVSTTEWGVTGTSPLSFFIWDVSRVGHNIALSLRRSRVRFPHVPQPPFWGKTKSSSEIESYFNFFLKQKRPGFESQCGWRHSYSLAVELDHTLDTILLIYLILRSGLEVEVAGLITRRNKRRGFESHLRYHPYFVIVLNWENKNR